MIKIIFLVLVSESCAAVGQVLFKKSANTLETHSLRGIANHIRFLKGVVSRPGIWLGMLAMSVSLAVWLIALAQGDLSLVFSLGSMQYILILFSAHFLLGEAIDMKKALGTFLVVFGIILIALS